MKKKKLCATLLAAAMAASLLSGCGGKSGGAGGSAGGAVTLKVWVPQNQIETSAITEMEAAFEKAHPEYQMTWVNEVVGEDKCKDEILKDVGNAADVFMFASDQLPDLVAAGAIAQLGGATEEMVKNDMAESVVNTVMQDGKVFAIPFTHNTFFMYYDKTLLDESDITSLEKIMAKQTADNVFNFYFESSGGWKTGCYYYGAGCSIYGPTGSDYAAGVDWNSPTGVAVTNYIIDLNNNKKCAWDGEITVTELIESHRLGAWFGGTWEYENFHNVLGDDLGMAVIPTFNPDGKDYQLKSFYGSKAIGVNAQSKSMAAAVQFAAFIGNEENQLLRYEKSQQPPANKKAGANEKVMADPLAAVLVKESETASVMQPTSPEFSARYWSNAGAIAGEIRNGNITKDNVQERMDKFVEAMTVK